LSVLRCSSKKDPGELSPDTRWVEDLKAKSVNYVQVIAVLEAEFDVQINFMEFRRKKTLGEAALVGGIGGAVGATFYLEPSATLDVDVFVLLPKTGSSSLVTLAPLYEYLIARGCKTDKEHIVIEGWPVQFLPPSNALHEEAIEQAVETEVEGIPTRVMTAEHLVAIALATLRSAYHMKGMYNEYTVQRIVGLSTRKSDNSG
jgi:acyl carrier protein